MDKDSIREFLTAVKEGNAARTKELLDSEPRLVNARGESGESAILLAIYHRKQDVQELLLARGAELNVFEAAAVGHRALLEALLQKDLGLVNAFAPDGFMPLGLAAYFGHRQIVDLLLARGAEVNTISRNATGYTALTGAVAGGHTEIIAALLAAGAKANYRYGPGSTPLHEAVASGNSQLVKLLLDHGADPNARTNDGQTPLALAESRGHHEICALLRQRAASA